MLTPWQSKSVTFFIESRAVKVGDEPSEWSLTPTLYFIYFSMHFLGKRCYSGSGFFLLCVCVLFFCLPDSLCGISNDIPTFQGLQQDLGMLREKKKKKKILACTHMSVSGWVLGRKCIQQTPPTTNPLHLPLLHVKTKRCGRRRRKTDWNKAVLYQREKRPEGLLCLSFFLSLHFQSPDKLLSMQTHLHAR